jgi:hypothetical protein
MELRSKGLNAAVVAVRLDFQILKSAKDFVWSRQGMISALDGSISFNLPGY